jgi:hypothetical protein
MSTQEEMQKRQRDAQFHGQNLADTNENGEAAEVLRYLADIDDLPIDKSDPIMGQLISKLMSTSNLSAEQVKSNEWVLEYLLILYLSKHPPKYGMHGVERAIAHDDPDERIDYLSPEDRTSLEAFIQVDKMVLTRSEDFEAVKESTRNVSESVVHDDNSDGGKGGIWGRITG